jgi:hypothetical protein
MSFPHEQWYPHTPRKQFIQRSIEKRDVSGQSSTYNREKERQVNVIVQSLLFSHQERKRETYPRRKIEGRKKSRISIKKSATGHSFRKLNP